MRYKPLFFHAFLIVFALTIGSACNAQDIVKNEVKLPKSLPAEIHQAYESGNPLVLFSFRNEIKESESYADWATYLNDFKENKGAAFLFFRVSPSDLEAIIPKAEEFTVFIKKGYTAYFYDGLIVEPQVYTSVYKIYSKAQLNRMDKAFLPEKLTAMFKQC